MRRALVATLALALVAGGGCLSPYRAHVDADTLAASDLAWQEEREPKHSGGWFGPNTKVTRYTFDPASDNPPFPGVLEVMSRRELNAPSQAELVDYAQGVVDRFVVEEGIAVDGDAGAEGERTLEGGMATRWFAYEGRVTGQGVLFPEDVTVRIVGEVGHDGRSRTSVVAVGIAQVDRDIQIDCPLIGPCPGTGPDLRTWTEIVGDADGSIGGAVSENGLLDHLVTHG